ncbi:MAG: hypothetical protein ACOCOC_06940 [Prevotella sp.]
MKGIKTEVKTDWKNYAHMTNSRYFRADKAWHLGYLDVSKGDTFFISCHIKWKVQKVGNQFSFMGQMSVWNFFGNPDGKTEGEYDFISPKLTMSQEPSSSHNNQIIYSTFINGDSTAVIGEDGYIEVTNFMCSKGDKPLPYIDCDELKAMGGAINKARIVALVLSEERRAA